MFSSAKIQIPSKLNIDKWHYYLQNYDDNMCTIKIFRGGRGGGWGGGSSEGCLKWGGGSGGSLRDLSKNVLKQGVGKGKSCS